MKILSVRNVVASLILAISTSASAAPVTLTIGNVFNISNNNGDLSPPIATSATVSFDLSNYSVSGGTQVIGPNSYRDITMLTFTAPTVQLLDFNAVPDFTPPPEDPGLFSSRRSNVYFVTQSERVNGAAARFTTAYFTFYAQNTYSTYSQSDASTHYVDFEYGARIESNNPNPNDGDPAQFLASVRQSPLSITSYSSFHFASNYSEFVVGDDLSGTAQLQPTNEVPEPASLLLLISGLLGALMFGRGAGRPTSAAAA